MLSLPHLSPCSALCAGIGNHVGGQGVKHHVRGHFTGCVLLTPLLLLTRTTPYREAGASPSSRHGRKVGSCTMGRDSSCTCCLKEPADQAWEHIHTGAHSLYVPGAPANLVMCDPYLDYHSFLTSMVFISQLNFQRKTWHDAPTKHPDCEAPGAVVELCHTWTGRT